MHCSIITYLFGAQFRSSIQCKNCSFTKLNFDPYMCVSLQVPQELVFRLFTALCLVLFYWFYCHPYRLIDILVYCFYMVWFNIFIWWQWKKILCSTRRAIYVTLALINPGTKRIRFGLNVERNGRIRDVKECLSCETNISEGRVKFILFIC